MKKVTEEDSRYSHLDSMEVEELLTNINNEDHLVAGAVQKVIPQVAAFVEELVPRFNEGGRLFYIGAGTSGRLGILDASEIPPTFGLDFDKVIGIIAGGDGAIRKAVERAEDNRFQAWEDLKAYEINPLDTVVGITASGTTPYVLGGVQKAKEMGCLTAGLTNNSPSELGQHVDHVFEVVVGPEFLTGSTRMKSGTAQKMVLNMISTSLMIRMGRVKGNKMVHMKISNQKLFNRGVDILVKELHISHEVAHEYLKMYGSVKAVLENMAKI